VHQRARHYTRRRSSRYELLSALGIASLTRRGTSSLRSLALLVGSRRWLAYISERGYRVLRISLPRRQRGCWGAVRFGRSRTSLCAERRALCDTQEMRASRSSDCDPAQSGGRLWPKLWALGGLSGDAFPTCQTAALEVIAMSAQGKYHSGHPREQIGFSKHRQQIADGAIFRSSPGRDQRAVSQGLFETRKGWLQVCPIRVRLYISAVGAASVTTADLVNGSSRQQCSSRLMQSCHRFVGVASDRGACSRHRLGRPEP